MLRSVAGHPASWRKEIKETQVKDFNRHINELASVHFTPPDHSREHGQAPKVARSLPIRKLDENVCTEQRKPITTG